MGDWCLARKRDNAIVPDAPFGKEVAVKCVQGYIPLNASVVCGPRSRFEPIPKCINDIINASNDTSANQGFQSLLLAAPPFKIEKLAGSKCKCGPHGHCESSTSRSSVCP